MKTIRINGRWNHDKFIIGPKQHVENDDVEYNDWNTLVNIIRKKMMTAKSQNAGFTYDLPITFEAERDSNQFPLIFPIKFI